MKFKQKHNNEESHFQFQRGLRDHQHKYKQSTVKMSLRQVGLLTAGAQPWSPRMCTANGDRFAYCSTLAIYIYEVK